MEKVKTVGAKATAGIAANGATGPSSAGVHQATKEARQEHQTPKGAKTKAEEKP